MIKVDLITDTELENWVEVPIKYLAELKSDPERFLRDKANIPTESITPFFRKRGKIFDVVNKELSNPFDEVNFCLEDWWTVTDNYYRYIHIDLAKNRDRAGIACCHVTEFIDVVRVVGETEVVLRLPLIKVDYMGAVSAAKDDEIDTMQFIDLIEETTNRGAMINLITFDQYQSQPLITTLRNLGYVSGVMSIDRTSYSLIVDYDKNFDLKKISTEGDISAAMNALRKSVYEDRLILPYHPLWTKECLGLEWIEDKGKVIKSVGSSDDLVQPIAGAVFNLENNEYDFFDNNEVQEKQTKRNTTMATREEAYKSFAEEHARDVETFLTKERKTIDENYRKD